MNKSESNTDRYFFFFFKCSPIIPSSAINLLVSISPSLRGDTQKKSFLVVGPLRGRRKGVKPPEPLSKTI